MRRAAYGFGGRNFVTRTPASVICSIRSRSILSPPTASMITFTRTPARARSHSASATCVAISPRQYTYVSRHSVRSALRIVSR